MGRVNEEGTKMTLPLTPRVIEAAYEYLRATEPFSAWHLPHADDVEFAVTRHRDREGDHSTYRGTTEHIIRVSSYHIKTTRTLLVCLAHEMIHAHMDRAKLNQRNDHGSQFKRLAARVCSVHGWEVEKFL